MLIKLTPTQKTRESVLSEADLNRAIYIDFEGFMNNPPTLLGYCCEQKFVQIVFDPALQSAASAKGLSLGEGKTVVADLLKRAIDERRRIVAYSQFDKNISFDELGADLSPVYADARLIAVFWLRQLK